MKEIRLANSKGVALVDDADFALLSQYRWYIKHDSRTNYAFGYVRGRRRDGKLVKMHRVITDAPDGMDVDHVNGDGLDNRRNNLRICTRSQNIGHSHKTAGCSSDFKGVSWDKGAGRWRAQGKIAYKCIYLGYYDSEEDAARAYNDFAREHFGEFALLNEV